VLSFNDELSVLASAFKGGLGGVGCFEVAWGPWSVLSPRGHFVIKVLMSLVNQTVGSLPLVHFILSAHLSLVRQTSYFLFC
jgi:hypothetical protein